MNSNLVLFHSALKLLGHDSKEPILPKQKPANVQKPHGWFISLFGYLCADIKLKRWADCHREELDVAGALPEASDFKAIVLTTRPPPGSNI